MITTAGWRLTPGHHGPRARRETALSERGQHRTAVNVVVPDLGHHAGDRALGAAQPRGGAAKTRPPTSYLRYVFLAVLVAGLGLIPDGGTANDACKPDLTGQHDSFR